MTREFFLWCERHQSDRRLIVLSNRSVILIVDDNEDSVLATSLRLQSAGFQSLTASDGNEGLASAIKHRPHAIVLDVRMPNKDGLAMLAELRSRDETEMIPVVMLSASILDQKAALDAGASFFVKKPYDGAQLVRAVVMAIAHRGNSDQAKANARRQERLAARWARAKHRD